MNLTGTKSRIYARLAAAVFACCMFALPSMAWAGDDNSSDLAATGAQPAIPTLQSAGIEQPAATAQATGTTSDIARASVSKVKDATYTGKAQKPKPTVTLNGKKLKPGRDYKLAYKANKKAGAARVVISGKGGYSGSKSVKFKIKRASISNAKTSSIASQVSTGSALEPVPVVKALGKKLKFGRDFTLVYRNNVSAGTAKAIVKGTGNFTGKKVVTFTIVEPEPVAQPEPAPAVVEEVFVTNTGEKYHLGWCTSLRRSKIPISRADAIAAGYEPCKVCNP